MKKRYQGIFICLAVMLVLSLGMFIVDAGAAAAGKVQYGGTLTLATNLNPISWDINDWIWKHANDTGYYMEHLLMGDLQKGPRGTKQYAFHDGGWIPPEVLRGQLLQSWEVKKSPSLQLIFHLRKGVMWQEKPGVMKAREFVADDVIYSINRLKNSPKAIPLYMDFIGKMETPDKHTLIINMPEWKVDWWYSLGWGYYDAIQAPEQEKAPGGPGRWENATGTGPFMITEYKDGHSQTYTKNPKYWDSDTIGGKKYKLPFVDKVQKMIIKDEQTRISAFRTGKIDILAIDWKYVDELKKNNPQLIWQRALSSTNFSLALRMNQKPFNDIRVRRAMNLAINKKEIIDSFYKGNAELHTYPFPPSFIGAYTPLNKLPPAARELYTYNPEKAKKLLAEAGYPNGFTFKAQISNNSQVQMDLAAMVVSYLDKIGVKLELDPMDYSNWLTRMMKKNHSEGIFFNNDQGGPYSGIRKNFLTGQTWNPHMMSDPYMDKSWQDAVENPKLTEKQSMEIMKKLAIYAIEQVPAIILPTPYFYMSWWPWVQNYYGELYLGAQNGDMIYSRVWIDQEMKKKMGY